MKQYMKGLILVGLMLCMITSLSFGTDVAINGEATANYDIYHSVTRVSMFKSQRVNDALNPDGSATEFLKLTVRNNTFDAFRVYLTPLNGVFKAQNTRNPDGTDSGSLQDGEANIPYTISVKKTTGTTGTGMTLGHGATTSAGYLTWPIADVQAGVTDPDSLKIFHLSASGQTSATDATIQVDVALDPTYIDKLSMAGNYHENIAITYEDL